MPTKNAPAEVFHSFPFRGKLCRIYHCYRNDHMEDNPPREDLYHFDPNGSAQDTEDAGLIDMEIVDKLPSSIGDAAQDIQAAVEAGVFDDVIDEFLVDTGPQRFPVGILTRLGFVETVDGYRREIAATEGRHMPERVLFVLPGDGFCCLMQRNPGGDAVVDIGFVTEDTLPDLLKIMGAIEE